MGFDSKLEARFASILKNVGIYWISQYRIKNKYYDFFLPEYKLLVEIDGDYIHTNNKVGHFINSRFKKKIFRNDALKNLIAEYSGFELLRIWETDLNNLNEKNIKDYLEQFKK